MAVQVADVLRQRGYRLTRPREAVFHALATAGGHLTAEAIADRVGATGDAINLASVYRSLAVLEEVGLARESRLGEGGRRWELAHPDAEFHLVCDRCGRVVHHGGELVDQVRNHLATEHGFTAEAVTLVVHGTCARCAGAARQRG